MKNWRLRLDVAAHGARNMATDEAILRIAAREENAAPLLRFYSWQPACLSIGRFQKTRELSALQTPEYSAGGNWVRRPTGGRAVWHDDEITYCIVLREADLPPSSRSVVGAYEWLSRAFLDGLKTLGIEAQLGEEKPLSTQRYTRATNCFESATRADFTALGRKLIGAAQMRRDGMLLQHGAIPLTLNRAKWRALAGGDMEKAVALRELGVTQSREKIIAALCGSLENAFGVRLEADSPDDIEREMVSALEREKYRASIWNEEAREAAFLR